MFEIHGQPVTPSWIGPFMKEVRETKEKPTKVTLVFDYAGKAYLTYWEEAQ